MRLTPAGAGAHHVAGSSSSADVCGGPPGSRSLVGVVHQHVYRYCIDKRHGKVRFTMDAADFVSVTGAPEFDVSEVATIHMEDTTPLNIATGAQGSGVLATPTQSMFQTAQIAIRMIANVNWAMRRTGMVQYIASGVSWA
jgi:hypothetical protein